MQKFLRLAVCGLLTVALPCIAQKAPDDFGPNGPKSDVVLEQQFLAAAKLVKEFRFDEAAPLLEDAVAQRPRNGQYREYLAQTLLGQANAIDVASRKMELRKRAVGLLKQARSLGDNSAYVITTLEHPLDATQTEADLLADTSPSRKALHDAELKYHQRDFAGAMPLYQKALDLDPRYYEAPLFAGDAMVEQQKFKEAGQWYAKAIAIDPNRETAYRYWGDALSTAGDRKLAGEKYIDAVVAEPYIKASWTALSGWANANHERVKFPEIDLPKSKLIPPTPGEAGSQAISLTVLDNMTKESERSWMQYLFKLVPDPAKPQTSFLQVELVALRAAIAEARKQKIKPGDADAGLHNLASIEEDGMLEAWVYLHDSDRETRQAYLVYRESHRDLLHAYIQKYDLHMQ